MEHAHYRNHQSLDYGHSRRQCTISLDTEQSSRVVPFRGFASFSWPGHVSGGEGGGDPGSSELLPSKVMNFTTAPPTPAQIELLNSYGSGSRAGKYAYFLDRGQGRVTRLIPADMLPPLNEIPAQQAKEHGMEILHPLGAPLPNGIAEINQRVTIQDSPSRSGPVSPTSQVPNERAMANLRLSPKKNKVYCDKWVHEGICAFTQQGCRFKHEMPYDKATQRSLGLFHGLPPWWRKLQADQQGQRPEAVGTFEQGQRRESAVYEESNWTTPYSRNGLAGSVPDTPVLQQNWRKGNRPVSTNGPGAPCVYPFGPIEPPRKLTQ